MKKLKRKILNLLLRNLFNAVSDRDVLKFKGRIDSGVVSLNEKILSKQEINNLAKEANVIKKTSLWKHLNRNVEYIAQERMFNKSVTSDDLVFPKAMLYNLDMLNKLLDTFDKKNVH